jgi:hypothetical protein
MKNFSIWMAGPAALLWVIIKSGSNPKRLAYPCQQAALPVGLGWLASVAALLIGSIFFRKLARVSLVGAAMIGTMWLIVSMPEYSRSNAANIQTLPVWEVVNPISSVFVMESIPPTTGSLAAGDVTVPDEYLPDPAIDTMLMLLEEGGVHFYKTTEQPEGIVGSDNVVVIKGNYQWDGRCGTNTDRVKGVIWKILNHPDGFTGEIIVADNTMDFGTGINHNDNNSEDRDQSLLDVISTFNSKGYPVNYLDWNVYFSNTVDEYLDGNYIGGFVYDPAVKTSYPKFTSPNSKYISFRFGIWDDVSSTYDPDQLCIINMPVLKAHYWAGATAAVKNWIGAMTVAYADERYGSFDDLHDNYLFGSYALVAKVMALTFPDLSILDAAWTSTYGPIDTNYAVNTNMLLASTDPVSLSYYAAKYILTPIATSPWQTDPDLPSSPYGVNLTSWSAYLKDDAGFDVTNDSAEFSVFNRDILIQPFTKATEGSLISDGGPSQGVSWADCNSDDYPELFVTNMLYPSGYNNNFYVNDGVGTFTKNTSDVIASDGGASRSASWGDYDNDGDVDLFVTNLSSHSNHLYENDGGGNFTELTGSPPNSNLGSSTSASWVDYNNDGDLDLFVSNYGSNTLYKNIEGTLTETTLSPLNTDSYDSYGAHWSDYDNDGDMDVFICVVGEGSPSRDNYLYRNDGSETFTKVTGQNIVTDGGASFGASWGDYDNDGDMDLFVANIPYVADGDNFLYQNNGDGTFSKDITSIVGSEEGYSFGSAWGDYDNDGDLDLFVANFYVGSSDVNYLYKNQGSGVFTRVTKEPMVSDTNASVGCAWADYDRDGDLDLYIANSHNDNEDNILYVNNGYGNNWINIKLIGSMSNKSAIGAKIRLKATINEIEVWQLREISGQTGYCSQNSLNAHFGLGNAAVVDSIKIEWPSGMIDILTDVAVNQFLTVTESYCGDVNDDESVNIKDITDLIKFKYKGGSAPQPNECMGDVNGDTVVNIKDITYLIKYKYKGGAKPVYSCCTPIW